MISLYRFDKTSQCGRWVHSETLLAQADQYRATADVLWIDLDNPTEAEEKFVFEKFFHVHPLTYEDINRLRREPGAPPHFPKVEEFHDYLFVIVNPLTAQFLDLVRTDGPETKGAEFRLCTQLSAVITQNILITHHYESVQSVRDLAAFLSRHEAQSERGPDYLFHLILDGMVDQYAPVLDHFDESLDEIELAVLSKPSQQLLLTLLRLKREIILLRKTLVYEREVLARLSRGEFGLIEEREMVYYRNVYDHLVRFSELLESSREMASDLMQTHLSALSNRLNDIMKVLTMISTTVLPMTLIAGIYGMNFKNLPEIDWDYGYFYALGLMGLTGTAAFLFFKWRKWV